MQVGEIPVMWGCATAGGGVEEGMFAEGVSLGVLTGHGRETLDLAGVGKSQMVFWWTWSWPSGMRG